MSNEETWEPVARVVFKQNSGIEQRIVQGSAENETAVCVKSRLLKLTAIRSVSLDLVESYDLLETTCCDCKKGLGYPRREWFGGYSYHRCNACEETSQADAEKRQEEYSAKVDRDRKRRDAILAAMNESDRELFRR
jgi:hypothetical protein